MGLFGWIKGQFIDIIEWADQHPGTLVWRFPRHNNEIKNGAKLIVREGQVAIFVNEGQLADVYKPGMYELSTQNMPVLSTLKGWKHGFESPFKCEVYFVSTVQYLDMKWGTMNPITLRDADFGIVRLRAYGVYSIRVDADQAPTFFRDIVGADGHVGKQKIEGQLRAMLVSSFTTALAQAKVPALDLAGNFDAIAEKCSAAMTPQFGQYGLKLTKFLIQSITLPREVEQAIDERASMGAIGNMGQYTQFQAAKAMRESASAPGGGAGSMMNAGAGLAMGQMMAQQMMGGLGAGMMQPAVAAPTGPTVGERLKQLKDLHGQGLIDDDTFAAKRDAILAEI